MATKKTGKSASVQGTHTKASMPCSTPASMKAPQMVKARKPKAS